MTVPVFEDRPETARRRMLYQALLATHTHIRRDLTRVEQLAAAVLDGLPADGLHKELGALRSNSLLWQFQVSCLRYCGFVHLHHHAEDVDGLTNATAAAGGIGLGMLVSSSVVQIGWEPRLLPYVVLLVLFAIAFAGAYWIPEPVLERSRFRLILERPSVPAVVRRPFVLAALAVLSSWSIGALFFSLGPQLAGHLFNTSNAILSGIGIVALAAAAAIAQLLTSRTAPWIAASAGSIAPAAGMIMIVVASATDSSVTYLTGSILGGAGFGAAFLGGLRALVAAIPSEHRAAVMSAFYVAAYGSLSVPAVLAGVAVTDLGLQSTFEIFGSAVAAIALVVAFEGWRTRPTRRAALQGAPEPARP